ncbi:hypothetical protein [Planctomicrobium sp. SH664]|uniref:hypothetical protein n=1 Tax=Planctomicrobium sp. SH664 TaxID=3448125 RepID=UPI003F5C14EB
MKRRFTGTILALIIAAGIYIGNHWKGPGLGGSGVGSGTPNAVETSGPTDKRIRVDNSVLRSDKPAGPTTLSTPSPLLVVVIHGDKYRLASAENPSQGIEISLPDLKERVTEVPGNDQGLRVRILNARDAQEGARSDLYTALAEAGVKREEIQERAEFVD